MARFASLSCQMVPSRISVCSLPSHLMAGCLVSYQYDLIQCNVFYIEGIVHILHQQPLSYIDESGWNFVHILSLSLLLFTSLYTLSTLYTLFIFFPTLSHQQCRNPPAYSVLMKVKFRAKMSRTKWNITFLFCGKSWMPQLSKSLKSLIWFLQILHCFIVIYIKDYIYCLTVKE